MNITARYCSIQVEKYWSKNSTIILSEDVKASKHWPRPAPSGLCTDARISASTPTIRVAEASRVEPLTRNK